MLSTLRTNKKNLILIASGAILLLAIGGILLYKKQNSDVTIKNYDQTKDEAFIASAFEKDMFWLSDNPDFNVQRITHDLNPRQSTDDYKGQLTIKILFDHEKPAGFVSYFKKNFYIGDVLFLWVDPTYRGKHYGEKLLQYAIDQLFAAGNKRVELVTRVVNAPARRIYEKVNMKEFKRDEPFIYYAINK